MARRRNPSDPFADYLEWIEHRYDPGYYLGGNLPPHLRKASLGPRARRLAGILLGIMALETLAAIAGNLGSMSQWELLGAAAGALLTSAAAVTMYKAGAPRARRTRRQPEPEVTEKDSSGE